MKEQGIRSNVWRWWCGGGVVGVAVVLGCASAVDFQKSGREAGSSRIETAHDHGRTKRSIANQHEHPHNGGKITMPVSVTFEDGESIQTLTRDKLVVLSITAGAEISSIEGGIEGDEGLKGLVRHPFDFNFLAAGENQLVTVAVPAKTGSLLIRINGVVNGQPDGTTLELKIRNPKEVSASSFRKRPADMEGGVAPDATGQLVQPMRAAERQ